MLERKNIKWTKVKIVEKLLDGKLCVKGHKKEERICKDKE